MCEALLILGSLLFSTFVFAGHMYIEYKEIKSRTSTFKLEDVLIMAFLSFLPIVNLFMLLSLVFRTWRAFNLNNAITNFIRNEK
jgi:hypothetical protein